MEKIKQSEEYYDGLFEAGGDGGVYHLPYRHSSYFPLFRGVLAEVQRTKATAVLEAGCGTGGFAHLLMDRTTLPYKGFDFSKIAVDKARSRTGRPDAFFVGNAMSPDS